ncbi:hypothetical protein JCM11251_000126 [Rhodosporidiobolus azoricus]
MASPDVLEEGDVRFASLARNSLARTEDQLTGRSNSIDPFSNPNDNVHRTPGHARQVPHFAPSSASSLEPHNPLPALLSNSKSHSDPDTPPRTPSPRHTRCSLSSQTLSLAAPQAVGHSSARPQYADRYRDRGGVSAEPYVCPVSALEGRRTPFFMASPDEVGDHEQGGAAPRTEAHYSLGASTMSFSSEGLVWEAPAIGTNLERRLAVTERMEAASRGNAEALETCARRRDSGYSEANAVQPFVTVDSLASRVVNLSELADSLHNRLTLLEDSAYARDRELDALRSHVYNAWQPLFSHRQQEPPQRSFVPPPLPNDLQDYPDESTLANGGDLTPPATAPPLRYPYARHLQHAPSAYESSRSATPRSFYPSPVSGRGWSSTSPSPVSRHDTSFPPPYGMAPFPSSQHHYHQSPRLDGPSALTMHQDFSRRSQLSRFNLANLPANDELRRSSQLAEQAFSLAVGSRLQAGHGGPRFGNAGLARKRSISLGGDGSGVSSSSSDELPKPTAMHGRSQSFGSSLSARIGRHAGSNCIVGQPNYRSLLENDADIDSEAFVRRILMHNDQQCSLFLQQRVRTTTEDRRKHLFTAVAKHVLELSQSKFGNFLVSRCLEAGDLKLAKAFETSFTDHFLSLALDPFGCHVVQKLLDCGDSATKARIVEELMPCPSTLVQKNAGHVWNRILTTSNPPAFYRRLAEMGQGIWAEVVVDDGGSLIVQHILEDWSDAHTSVVAREILEKVEDVAKSACGSFLVDRSALPFCSKIMQIAPTLLSDNFGAKIVDRCLRSGRAPLATVASLATDPSLLVRTVSHTNGTQVLHGLLTGPPTSISHRDKDKLGRFVLSHAALLAHEAGSNGTRLVSVAQQQQQRGPKA